MGYTVDDALLETQNLYHLKLLAGKKGCSNSMTWVQMIEDMTILQRVAGKVLVVTTGLGFPKEELFFEFVQTLIKVHSVGLIVNTGKYIKSIPTYIIDYCEANDFPLLTSPWEVTMYDLIKDLSYRIIKAERDDKQINKIFIETLINPRVLEDSRPKLITDFDVESSFQVLVIYVPAGDQMGSLERRHLRATIEICFEKIEGNYAFFWLDGHYVLIMNGIEQELVSEIVKDTSKRLEKRLAYPVYIGVGSRMMDLRNLTLSYKRSEAACRMALHFNDPYFFFDDMGVYQILFSIEDRGILRQIEQQYLGSLREYDQKHNSELEETLHNYLLYDCNLKAMSEGLFLHRNTINYRMNKIKEITGCNFYSFEDKVPYMIAFYIKDIL